MNYLSITSAAARKNVSRGAVTQAVAAGKIHQTMIKDVAHILENRAFENWTPGVKPIKLWTDDPPTRKGDCDADHD